MSDLLRSLVRTAVPAVWASVLVWLASNTPIPAEVLDVLDDVDDTFLVPAVLAALYAGLRWLETRRWMPRWLVRVLLGSDKAPRYDR